MQSVRVTQEKVATRPESDMHYAEKRQVGGGIQSTRRLGGGRLSLATQYAEMHRGGGGGGERGRDGLRAAYDTQADLARKTRR